MSRHIERTTAYNTAYLTADRSQLLEQFDLDPAGASGRYDSVFDELVPPADRAQRREAVLEFYGHRCGRCSRPLATADPCEHEYLGYAFSVGRVEGAEEPWALDELVALCEPCFDLVDASEASAVGRVSTRFRQSPQFPSWHCDPRVAVERAPLSGRELFRRERLTEAVTRTFDFRVNAAVAQHAALALPTPASRAVAFGVRLLSGSMAPPDDEQCPERAWDDAPPSVHVEYADRVLTPRQIASGDRWARPPGNTDDGPTEPEVSVEREPRRAELPPADD